ALADSHRRHELGIRPDEGIVLDDGLVLIDAVVVAGNGARPDIHAGAYLRVPDIRQVIGFRTLAQDAFLDFDEVADVGLAADISARTQAGVWPDPGIVRHLRFLDMAIGLDLGVRPDGGITDYAVRPDAHAVGKLDMPLENTADVDEDVAPAGERTAQVEARGIGERNALLEQPAGLLGLPMPFQLSLLQAAVDAQRFPGGRRMGGVDGQLVGHGKTDDVGEVVLTLSIIVVDALQPALQPGGGRDQYAGVHFGDGQFGGIGVFMLDDALDVAALVAHDAPIAGGVFETLGKDGHAARARVQQALKRIGLDKRHVAIQYQCRVAGRAVVQQQGCRLLDGMAGALLRALKRELQVRLAMESRLDLVSP